ncbi:hypothetical protein DAEQUDRAFT_100875 [Daedalea quercina L-15889]|uniref:Uncharacterized protein n=1 Tax=Daedalea quercina L-15889 TaxID=1314783 RepID=A0A165KWU7_9APHY|nr:hypothetical protein DAEQUDRAFT_100875 [Daedalea quercina L-15889]
MASGVSSLSPCYDGSLWAILEAVATAFGLLHVVLGEFLHIIGLPMLLKTAQGGFVQLFVSGLLALGKKGCSQLLACSIAGTHLSMMGLLVLDDSGVGVPLVAYMVARHGCWPQC